MAGLAREQPNSRLNVIRQPFRISFAAALLVALGGCGGGGGGGGNPPPSSPPANPPTNSAPTVDAGADQTIQLPTDSVSVSGSADDADGDTLTHAWSAEPADGVVIADAAAPDTTVTFAAAGTYTLTLTVNDGTASAADTLQVTVEEAPTNPPANNPPTVEAGADQSIQLPANSVSLSGTASDPDGDTLTYEWTADPANGVSFADATAPATTATFSAPGTYALTLTANDGETTGSDSLTVTVQPAASAELYWPMPDLDESVADRGWIRVTPGEVGMDAALLEQAANYALTANGAGMVVKGGRLVHSWAGGNDLNDVPATIDSWFSSQSATKSIGGMALGLAIQDGLIALSDFARDRLLTFGQPPDANDVAQLETITILQLATHTAGFEKEQTDPNLLYAPGSTWAYSDGALNWLADILTTVYNRDLRDVLTERVWAHLGVNQPSGTDDVRWRENASRPTELNGVPTRELSSGIQINANAMARVGLLFLRNGMWSNGPVLPESFITTSRTPPPEIASAVIAEPEDFPGATTDYGVLWWTNTTCQLPNVPSDAYWAWGQYESLIVVIPSLDLVISRIGPPGTAGPGRVFGEPDWNADYAVLAPFLDPIVASTGATGEICVP